MWPLRGGRVVALMALSAAGAVIAGASAVASQPVEDETEAEIDDAAGDADLGMDSDIDSGTPATHCIGDGDAVDTGEEIAEFGEYPSDEYFVLDDDNDCADDDTQTVGYSLPGDGPMRAPGVLPSVAAGTAPTAGDRPAIMVRRSTGGRAVREAEAPWQVQIFQPWTTEQLTEWGTTTGGKALWEFQHLCGATLVADNWALTASHCLPPSAARNGYRVRLGAETIHTDSGYTYRIDRIVAFNPSVRPTANGIWPSDDISLIHFTDDRNVGRPPARQARVIAIDRGPELPDAASVYATGWGRVSNRTTDPTSTMMKVQLNIVGNSRCAQGPWGRSFVHDRVLCAAAPGRQTCQGDSGGPLVNSVGPPRLVGIVSWNNADCIGDVGRQGIYTRVARYADWIERTIGR